MGGHFDILNLFVVWGWGKRRSGWRAGSSLKIESSTAKLRIWTLRIWGFRGPGFRSARQVLCGDASRLFLDHFSQHLNSVLGRTELCHEVWNPRPQKPQIIHNENHHLALFGRGKGAGMRGGGGGAGGWHRRREDVCRNGWGATHFLRELNQKGQYT